MNLPKVLILIPVWKRPEITELCFSGLNRIRKHRPNLAVLTIISEEDYEARCNRHKVAYTFFENQPLGAKKNHGLQEALKLEWDYLMEINSDDLIANELLDLYDTLDDDYLALRNFCFVDSKTLECRQVESKTAYGIGRRYSRKAVESCLMTECFVKVTCITNSGPIIEGTKVDLKPYIAADLKQAGYVEVIGEKVKMWNDEASACMDNFSDQRLKDNGFECHQIFTDKPLAVDIKSDVNIWAFNPEGGVKYSLDDLKRVLPELDGLTVSNETGIYSDQPDRYKVEA